MQAFCKDHVQRQTVRFLKSVGQHSMHGMFYLLGSIKLYHYRAGIFLINNTVKALSGVFQCYFYLKEISPLFTFSISRLDLPEIYFCSFYSITPYVVEISRI